MHVVGTSRRRRQLQPPKPHAVATLPSENTERHRTGPDAQRIPRPLGMMSGIPYEPREPTRSFAGSQVTHQFIEALDGVPFFQPLAAKLFRVIFAGASRNDAPLPPDAPDPKGAWKFAALGDYGAGTPEQARVSANILAGKPDLVITAGDNVYPTGRWQDYQKNFDPPHLSGRLAREVPFMPALGNHDMYRDDLRPYFGHFPHLGGQPYYTFRHKNAQFFSIDSDQDLRRGSSQYRWLDQELGRSDRQWKVVYLHYPMYGMGSFDEIRESVQPLLAKHGVQLVVAGHEHSYLRSVPISGVTHILTGGGGQQVWPFDTPQPAHLARRVAAFHHVEVSVGSSQLVARAIDEDGKRIDTTVIPYRGVQQAQEGVRAIAPAAAAAQTTGRRRRAGRSAPAPNRR